MVFLLKEAPRSTENEDRNICERRLRVQRLPLNCISEEGLLKCVNNVQIYIFDEFISYN